MDITEWGTSRDKTGCGEMGTCTSDGLIVRLGLLSVFSVMVLGGGIDVAKAQQAITDWSPYSEKEGPNLIPGVLPPNLPSRNPNEPAWLIKPSIEVDGTVTDNALGTPTDRQADFYTTISPDLFISGQSPRLQGVLNLNPQLIYFAKESGQDQVLVNAFSNGTAVIVPERLFFDEQGSISQQDRSGVQGYGNPTVVPADQRVQQYAYSLSPHVYIPFSRDTDAELRYRFSQVLYGGNTGEVTSTITGLPLAPISNSTEQEAYAKLKSTALWDRLLLSVTGDYDDFSSPGSGFSSTNLTGALGASYLVVRNLWATASVGYEDLNFPDLPQVNYAGPIWEVGGRFAPAEDRLVALSYGSYEGHLGFKGQLRYALRPGISIFANYLQAVQTPQQQLLENLPFSTQLAPGNTLDTQTGLPLYLTNPNIPLENGVFYAKSLTAGATALLGRNTLTITFDYEDDKELAGASPSQTSLGGFVGLSRELSPKTSGQIIAGYSLLSQAELGLSPATNSRAATFGINFNYNITETLQAHATYSFQLLSGGIESNVIVDLLTVGIQKSF